LGKSIETKVSRTAEAVCCVRAVSLREKKQYYRCEDDIAPVFCPPLMNVLARTPFFRKVFRKHLFGRSGVYEYVVCRTKLIDEVFKSLSPEIRQVVILGAGFDSRAIRFQGILKDRTVFEVDSPVTQASKLAKLREKRVDLPGNLRFLALDFDRDSLADRLFSAGFDPAENSLFVLEGVTMFLEPESAQKTFAFIGGNSGKKSLIAFDYARLLPEGERNEISETVAQVGEKYRFGIEKGKVADFLASYGLFSSGELQAKDLKERFGKKEEGEAPADLFGIVLAKKV
jgi:methyltransferase (TIGR00027 family)